MAGSGASQGFSSAEFREAILFASTMSMPDTEQARATFQWEEQKTFTRADPSGKPYDWTATPLTESQHADVQIPVAVKYEISRAEVATGTDIGRFSRATAEITILDTYYDDVLGANTVLLNGHTYDIVSVLAEGLFDVTIYTMHVIARSLP